MLGVLLVAASARLVAEDALPGAGPAGALLSRALAPADALQAGPGGPGQQLAKSAPAAIAQQSLTSALSETFWKGKRAKLESQQRKLALDLAEGQEREQLMHKLLEKVVQREAAGREAAVEQLQAELARTKLDAEVNLQKTAAYWISKLAEQDKASREKVENAELSAEAQQQLQKAQLQVAALEAELRIASLAAETNLQKTATFWISKLAEAHSEAEVQRARAAALELELERAGLWQALESASIQEQPAEVAPAAEEKPAAPAADVESAQTPAEEEKPAAPAADVESAQTPAGRAAALRAAYDARVAKERAERR